MSGPHANPRRLFLQRVLALGAASRLPAWPRTGTAATREIDVRS